MKDSALKDFWFGLAAGIAMVFVMTLVAMILPIALKVNEAPLEENTEKQAEVETAVSNSNAGAYQTIMMAP